MSTLRTLVVCLVLARGSACTGDRSTSVDTGQGAVDISGRDAELGRDVTAYDFCEGPIVAVFDPGDGLVLPFPSDLFTAEDLSTPTGLRVHFTQENSFTESMFLDYPALRAQLNALDGFGTTAGLVFALSDEIGCSASSTNEQTKEGVDVTARRARTSRRTPLRSCSAGPRSQACPTPSGRTIAARCQARRPGICTRWGLSRASS